MEPLISVDQKAPSSAVQRQRAVSSPRAALQHKNKMVRLIIEWTVAASEQKNTREPTLSVKQRLV